MWKGSGRTMLQTLVLENFKFVLFVCTPIVTAAIFHSDKAVEWIVRNRQYVTYPAEEAGTIPTNEEELAAAMAEIRRRRNLSEGASMTAGRHGGATSFTRHD